MYSLACLGLCMLSWWMPRGTGWLSQAKADSEKPFSCPFLHSSGIGLNQLSLKPWGAGFRVITEGRCRCCSGSWTYSTFFLFSQFWEQQFPQILKISERDSANETIGTLWFHLAEGGFFCLIFWFFFIVIYSFGWKEGMERQETSYLICTMKFPVLPLDFLRNYF